MSYARMSAALNIPEKLVRRRVVDLREQGVIQITTVGDPALMGYGLTALIGVVVSPSARLSDVAERLAQIPGAFYVTVTTGRYNVLVELSCRDDDHLLATIDGALSLVDGLISAEVFPYLRLHFQNPSFEAARQKGVEAGTILHRRLAFDELDREIIQRLHDDGRRAYLDIARDLDVSEARVRQRVKRMVSAGALRVMALTIPRGVGFETVAIIAIRVAAEESVEAVASALAGLPAVIYVAICAGRFDVFAEVVCTDREDLLRLLDGEVRNLKGVLATEVWPYLRLFYRSVRPAPTP